MDKSEYQRKRLNEMKAGIKNIVDLNSFSNWLEGPLGFTKNNWGKDSAQYREVRSTKSFYQLSPSNKPFDLQQAIGYAHKIIGVCEDELEEK